MVEDSESGGPGEGPDELRRLAALARIVPALAHRLNNALMAVTGLGELVLSRPDAPVVQRIAATADEQGRRVVRSIKALSELAKPPEGVLREADLRETLISLEHLIDPLAEAAGARFEVVAPHELPARVEPRALLHRLTTHAVDAYSAPDPRLRLVVRRNAQDWCFDLVGVGLGAEVSQQGAVGVELRSRGRVARLRLRVPALGGGSDAGHGARGVRGRKANVLVFERDAALGELVQAVLDEGGYSAAVVSSEDDAREALRRARVDVLLLSSGGSTREQLAAHELAQLARAGEAAVGVVGSQLLAERLQVPAVLRADFRPGELLEYLASLSSA